MNEAVITAAFFSELLFAGCVDTSFSSIDSDNYL
jgi:hypothetical protein